MPYTKAVNIEWDVEGEDVEFDALPDEIPLPANMTDVEEISDYITEQTGFCHKGFELI